jgi:APA family basic amino acid/polyamine antiporter
MVNNNSNKSNNLSFLSTILRKKDIDISISDTQCKEGSLCKSLTWVELVILGIGAIIGAGIFTLAGTAAAGSSGHPGAGPGLILSFALSGTICCITALCYAELASMIPIAGSAYTYTYTTMGEIFAWIIGWALMLEYMIGSIAVACGWSGYFLKMLEGYEKFLHLPEWLVHPPFWLAFEYNTALQKFNEAGMTPDFPMIFGFPVSINIPAMFVVLLTTVLLYIGIKESTKVTGLMVIIKLG